MTNDLVNRTATDLAAAIRNGEVSSVEVVTAHLDRIDEVNGAVNAIVVMYDRDRILADAAAADSSEAVGPLHGLPTAVKDLEAVEGLPTRMGSVVTPDTPAEADSFLTHRLRAAGAIIVGKTNTPEYGVGSHTFNEVYGYTNNPWDLSKSAGGSSGGAAAALASRMLPIADGSDYGGSLRNPAGFCNVVGLRPSIGRVPQPATSGSTYLHRLGVSGPMARTVRDTALHLQALAGPTKLDPLALPDSPDVFGAPLPDTTTARLAWGGNLDLFPNEAEPLAIAQQAAKRIVNVGGTYADDAPDLSDAMRVFWVYRGLHYARLASALPRETLSLMKPAVLETVDFGLNLTVEDIIEAEIMRANLHLEMIRFFENYDVLALPTAQVAPFPSEVEWPTEVAGQTMTSYLDWMTTCCVVTPTGCPAISIPAGFTAAGLPVGIQLVAAAGNDQQLLAIAAALEASDPLHLKMPEL